MQHAILATYFVCFAGGVALIVTSALASRRLALGGLLDFALLFSAGTLLMVVETMKTYERAVRTDFGAALHVTAILLTAAGNGGIAWYLPSLVRKIVNALASLSLRIGFGAFALLVAALGAGKETTELFGVAGPGTALWNVDVAVLIAIHLGAWLLLLRGLGGIENPRLKDAARTFLVYLGVFLPLAIVELLVKDASWCPAWLRDYPLSEIAYYLGFVILSFFLLARYFSEPTQGATFSLPEDFVSRFGISLRERDIIEMMAKGVSNSAIAEKLFISTMTVKNHVYHIYRKTGAGNKVQLLNMINSLK